jgi:SAM-dependent methyltransferase
MQGWRDFWNGTHSIYVSERHRALHDELVAQGIQELLPEQPADVLDFGCGEATRALETARRCRRLYLCDAAPSVRERLAARFAHEPSIVVLAPEDVSTIPAGSLALVSIVSVLQYLSAREWSEWASAFRPLLAADGRLVVADVIPPDASALSEAASLVKFGIQGGFAGAAVLGLARTAFSDYRRLRTALGLTRYSQAEMLRVLSGAGYAARRMPRNIGHNQQRMAFEARPAPGITARAES